MIEFKQNYGRWGEEQVKWVHQELGRATEILAPVLICCFLLGIASAQAQNHAEGADFSVVVGKVANYGRPTNPLYLIEYSYAFKNRSAVFIPGIGAVLPNGKFGYLSNTPTLEFREVPSGRRIITLELKETVTEMGVLTAKLPKTSDFPEGQAPTKGQWSGPTEAFNAQLQKVLEGYFHPTYAPCDSTGDSCVITTFSDLSDLNFQLPKNVRGEVALMITYARSGVGTSFSIFSKALESRSHDPDWLEPVTKEISRSSGLLSEHIRRELQKP